GGGTALPHAWGPPGAFAAAPAGNPSPGRAQGRAQSGARTEARRARRPACATAASTSTGGAAAAHLLALDQVLPEGARGQRQAGLLHRKRWTRRIGYARGRGGADRSGKRPEESAPRPIAAPHGHPTRNPG